MAARGPLWRVLPLGMICGALLLAWVPSDGLADSAAPVVLGPPGDATETSSPTAADLAAIVESTLTAEELQSVVAAAADGSLSRTDNRLRALAAALEIRQEALTRVLAALGREDVASDRLVQALAEIVARQKSLLAQLRLLEPPEPRAAELRDAATEAIETGQYDHIGTLMAEAEAIHFEALRQILALLDQSSKEIAAIYPEAGARAGPQFGFRPAQQGALLHGGLRPGFGPMDRFGRFCDWHPGHRLCERRAVLVPFCDRFPNHAQCTSSDDFCREHPDHRSCEQPPSDS